MSVMMMMVVIVLPIQLLLQLLEVLLIPLLTKLLRLDCLPPSLGVELRLRLQSQYSIAAHIFIGVCQMIRLVQILAEQLLEGALLRTVLRLLLVLLFLPVISPVLPYSTMLALVNPTDDRRTLRVQTEPRDRVL